MNRLRRQFVLSQIDRFPKEFLKHDMGNGFILAWHPELPVKICDGGKVALMGDAWQSDPTRSDPRQEIEGIKAGLTTDEIIYDIEKTWVGEYVLIVGDSIYTDASALRSVYYSKKTIAGDIHLIDYNLNLDEQICKTVLLTGIPFMPVPVVDRERDIRVLLPSQVLEYCHMTIRKRPLIIDNFEGVEIEKLRELFIDSFCYSLKEMRKALRGTMWLSLTGGRDSRTTLALIRRAGIDFNCFTIERSGFLYAGLEDFFYPPILSSRIGVPHYGLRLNFARFDESRFREYLLCSYGLIQGNSVNDYAYGIHDDLRRISRDGQVVWIRSSMWETYCDYLVGILLESADSGFEAFFDYNRLRLREYDSSITRGFKEYYEWISSNPEPNINMANRFYWEEGGASWMAPTERVTEMTEGVTAVQPLNSRFFLSILLSVPDEYKKNRRFQIDMTDYLCPEFKGIGYSAEKKLYDMPYYFPYHLFPMGANIVLYGAGESGTVCLRRIKRDGFLNVVVLADARADEILEIDRVPVVLPNRLHDYKYDYVFISIRNPIIAWQAKFDLVKLGIDENRIKYTQPLLYCELER